MRSKPLLVQFEKPDSQLASGFSLVELLISVLLGSYLISLMFQHYLAIKQNHQQTLNTLSHHYDQQLIMDLMRTSIQQAGFTPCAPLDVLITPSGSSAAMKHPISFANGDGSLQISRMSEDFSILKGSDMADSLLVEPGIDLKNNELILIADCFHAELARIQSVRRLAKAWRVNLRSPLRYSYIPPVYIGEWLQEQFYVDKNPKGRMAFYYKVRHAEELSETFSAMTVQRIGGGKRVLLGITLLPEELGQEGRYFEVAARA